MTRSRYLACVAWVAIALGSGLAMSGGAVADDAPVLNIEAGCSFAASLAQNPEVAVEQCRKDEESARLEIVKGWSEFASNDRQGCLEQTRIGGQPSYVDVLTCVRMLEDARILQKKNPMD